MNKKYLDFIVRLLLLTAVEIYFVFELFGYKVSDFRSNAVENWKGKAFVLLVVFICPYVIYIEIRSYLKTRES